MNKHCKSFVSRIFTSFIILSSLLPASSHADDNTFGAWEQKAPYSNSSTQGYISPRASVGRYADDNFSGYNALGIAFGYDMDSKQSLELDFGIANAETDRDGRVTGMFDDNPRILIAAINYRYFFNQRHEFPGAYILAGLAYNSLYWDYREGLQDKHGEAMNSDEVDGTEITLGIGMTVMSMKNIDLRFEILPAVVIWDDKTDNGIDHGFNPGRLVKFRMACDFYMPN